MGTICIQTAGEQETIALARSIAPLFAPGAVVLLDGEMGAGKTHFVKGVAEHFGYDGEVTSPTFTLANFYESPGVTLLHMDLYRIEGIDEFNDLGLLEYFPESVVLIEWGVKIADHLTEYLQVHINYHNHEKESRQIVFSGQGAEYEQMAEQIGKIVTHG
ncbi:MAG: tRNA (adenosine(37)-N6)-threonylcarbamoyltransferase complex ATPase subunit type 1 TsaE [Dinghuibacter sp.]|nr:tRNA (adenosine(37)-N6)-threonylcarbamoyltransferase complex ATPase subunit type 1 TsaE [Dinghuibacter sp.]